MSSALELRNISFTYSGADKPVFENINMTLDYGEFVLLSGLSGEGKSTLLSIINGIIPNVISGKMEGNVFFEGRDVTNEKVSARSKYIGTVLQNADEQIVYDVCADEIAFGCENFCIEPSAISRRIDKSCKLMKLSPDSFTKVMSGGQKQRLVTASTLAMQQKIIILDEPLANLDCESAHTLLKTLRKLSCDGYAILLVEHRLDMVSKYVGRVLWIKERQLYSSGGMNELISAEKRIPRTDRQIDKNAPVVISGKNLCYSAGGKDIIKELNVDIRKGERIVLLGENGCGKTTLMRVLARLNKLSGGVLSQTVLPNDKKKKPTSKWFKKVGFVYQNPSYQLFMPTLKEEVSYQAATEEIADRMIKLFGLSGLESRHPQSLSEGQKRRAGIAAICAGLPEVIFLDEPTVGQDYDHLCQIVNALNILQAEHKFTMITVTHDFRCASALADRVLIMAGGKIKHEGRAMLADGFFGIKV